MEKICTSMGYVSFMSATTMVAYGVQQAENTAKIMNKVRASLIESFTADSRTLPSWSTIGFLRPPGVVMRIAEILFRLAWTNL